MLGILDVLNHTNSGLQYATGLVRSEGSHEMVIVLSPERKVVVACEDEKSK